jgi:hypothetical protein
MGTADHAEPCGRRQRQHPADRSAAGENGCIDDRRRTRKGIETVEKDPFVEDGTFKLGESSRQRWPSLIFRATTAIVAHDAGAPQISQRDPVLGVGSHGVGRGVRRVGNCRRGNGRQYVDGHDALRVEPNGVPELVAASMCVRWYWTLWESPTRVATWFGPRSSD